MTVFSPVSSARYRRSSVSINPSCPSQVGVIIMMIYLLSVSVSHPSFLLLLLLQLVPLSPFSLTGDRHDHKRQVRTETLLFCPLWEQSVHESRSERLDWPDDRKGFHLVLHLIWFMNFVNNFPPGKTNKPFVSFSDEKENPQNFSPWIFVFHVFSEGENN